MRNTYLTNTILNILADFYNKGQVAVSASQLCEQLSQSRPTVNRYLENMVVAGDLIRIGKGPATRYQLPAKNRIENHRVANFASPQWSKEALDLQLSLQQPLGSRTPITYQRHFLENYQPNISHLLPVELANSLYQEGQMRGQQPAGTYARKILEPLLLDLSWWSSQLEGNRYSVLATEELFKRGRLSGEAVDSDAVMLLNHKAAIEFMVDAVPSYGLTTAVIYNLHSLLMQDLLADVEALGTIRTTIVNITGTTYIPTQIPVLLEEMLTLIIEKARLIKNPIEAAFFMWVHLAYLQPFEDGNKRTSRLSSNIPLMLYNCSPLSFLDVNPQDYSMAMMGVYEQNNSAMAVDLFAWTYRRSVKKYAVMLESLGAPDPLRAKYRELLTEVIQAVVREQKSVDEAMQNVVLDGADSELFMAMLRHELSLLGVHNCARYRLSMAQTEAWVGMGMGRF